MYMIRSYRKQQMQVENSGTDWWNN